VFHLTPDSGRADIDTRVRIEEYSYVRAIAEMNDGKLYMAMRYVRASGGCSAPAGKDQEAALARLGKMKFRLDNEVALNRPNLAQLMISHPNNSGLQMDQLTRHFIPARFVKKIDVTYSGKLILSAEVDFSISENPNFRFYFIPRESGELKAEVIDSSDLQFNSYIMVEPGVTAAGS
jgi:sulfur-oxidizing protein SoxY